MDDLAQLSDDQLADSICTWAGRVAAGMARLLGLVAEFDRREAWGGPGMLSCAHWLSWRIGLSPGTAREWVRVARRLEQLPAVRAAFEGGQLSWSQARAITRVATTGDGVDWVDLSRHSSGAQLEKIVRGVRRAQQNELAETDPDLVAYRLRTRARYDDHGNLALTIYAPAEDAPAILAGIEAQRAELERRRAARAAAADPAEPVVEPTEPTPDPTDPTAAPTAEADPAPTAEADPPADVPAGTLTPEAIAAYFAVVDDLAEPPEWEPVALRPGTMPAAPVPAGTPTPEHDRPRVTEAEALLAMARTALDQQQAKHPDVARRTRARLVAQVDPLSGWGRLHDGELLPPTSLKAVMRTLPGRGNVVRLRPLTQADLTRHDLGRGAREANQPLRELLGAIDGERCRFPGCTRHRKLHAHHVRYWSAGGATDLANLVLVCARHHTLIHAQGFVLVLHSDRRLDVTTAEGGRILHHPGQPWGAPEELDPTGRVNAHTLPPTATEPRMDLGYVVHVLRRQAA